MAVQFSFMSAEDGTETIVLAGSQGVAMVPGTHANFSRIKASLFGTGKVYDEAKLYQLANAAADLTDTLQRLSPRVTIKGDKIFFDGDEMESRLTRHIVEMVRGGDENYQGYVLFLENVQLNPSKRSRKALFKFLDKHDLIITDDGCFIGYKAVRSDGKSDRAGSEPVTVTLADGTVEVHTGRIPYPVGATVEMARSLVDDNRDVACSVGLHVGNHHYASTFLGGGSKLLTVKVNPRDVVSVPSDSNDEKIRACRFTVLEDNPDKTRYEGTSFRSLDEVVPADAEDDEALAIGFEDEDEEDLDYDHDCDIEGCFN